MKKTILSTALALLSLVSGNAQNANESKVTATIKGIPDGTEMQAVLAATHRDEKPLATGVVKNGKISFTLPVTEARMIGIGTMGAPYTFTYMTKGGENVTVSLTAKNYGDNTTPQLLWRGREGERKPHERRVRAEDRFGEGKPQQALQGLS